MSVLLRLMSQKKKSTTSVIIKKKYISGPQPIILRQKSNELQHVTLHHFNIYLTKTKLKKGKTKHMPWLYQPHCGGILSHSVYNVTSVQTFISAQISWGPTTTFQSGWRQDFGGLQDIDSFLFQQLEAGNQAQFAAVLGIIVCPSLGQALAAGQMSSHLTLDYSAIQRSSWLTPQCCVCFSPTVVLWTVVCQMENVPEIL